MLSLMSPQMGSLSPPTSCHILLRPSLAVRLSNRRKGPRGTPFLLPAQLPAPHSLSLPSKLIVHRNHASTEDSFPSVVHQDAAIHEGTAELAPSADFVRWDSITSRLSGSATLAFLMLQLPQIVLNSQNLINGNSIALFAVQWRGQLTCLLGNLCLLSYFAKKRETGAMVVQAVGVISTWVVLLQLSVPGAMPSSSFIATTTAVGLGLLINLLNLKGFLSSQIWEVWEDAITIGSVSVLPQVMWSTFEPVLPQSRWPGAFALVIASSLIILKRLHKLPSSAIKILDAVSAWTATLLFMWGPVAQMQISFAVDKLSKSREYSRFVSLHSVVSDDW